MGICDYLTSFVSGTARDPGVINLAIKAWSLKLRLVLFDQL